MKRRLRGFKRSAIELDFNLYRVDVPIPGLSGNDLSVIDVSPEGARQTIVFVHGYAGAAETWEHQINYFYDNYRVVAPDLRGHGQSDAPYTRYTMKELVADLYAITQKLELPEKFILIGHSFGGAICVEYANAHPEQLERLVLIATAVEHPLPKIVSLLFRLPVAFFRPWWKYRPRWNAEIHVMKRMGLNNLQRWKGLKLMNNIETPTLVITGERDTYFPRQVYEDVGEAVPGAEVINIGASKHKVQLERHQAVNRAIERFIEGTSRSTTWRRYVDLSGIVEKRPWLDAYLEGTPRTVPIPRRPLHEFLQSAADWLPRHTAIRFYNFRWSYAQLLRRVNQTSHALVGLGVKPGDRVMIVLPNMPEFVMAFYGILTAGGVAVLSNPDADIDQVLAELQQTEARVLFTLDRFSGLAQAAKAQAGVREVVLASFPRIVPEEHTKALLARWRVAGEPAASRQSDDGKAEPLGITYDELLMDTPYEPPDVTVDSEDMAAILYTTGTTDKPKGACLTHLNLVANAIQTRHWMPDLRYGKETFLTVVPLLHSYGLTTAMNLPVVVGGTMVMLPDFKPQTVLEEIQRYRPSVFAGVPSMFAALAQVPGARGYGLSSIQACISGSSPLPVEVQESFEKLTRGRLVEGYGLTEASPVTHANPLNGKQRPGSIGVPLPNTDAKIVDLATGVDLPAGQVGELWVKGPQVMMGYWRRPEITAKYLHEGWMDTGDVAVMDGDGYFHILGRTRDLIRAGEYTVYPRDVEELLYESSKVEEVAVVGVPRAAKNQKVKAFVVPRPGVELSADELLELCRRRLDDYAVPWQIEFREKLPKSFTGKVIRRLLVE